jgi:hypothetical protein
MNKHERYWDYAKCPRPESRVQSPESSEVPTTSIYLSIAKYIDPSSSSGF